MSFGLGHGRTLDDAPGVVGVSSDELPPMPDDLSDVAARQVDPRQWFADPAKPFEIEIGSGKGTFLIQQGSADPQTNILGIEWAREFYQYTADRVRRRQLTNVRVLHTDASQLLRWRVPDGICRVIHLYFSDPWPKKRHHKKRVVQDTFLEDAHRILIAGGELRVVTDHDDLWAWDCEHFDRWCADDHPMRFDRLEFDRPESAGEGEVVGTNFERKYTREGRPFHACTLRKPTQ